MDEKGKQVRVLMESVVKKETEIRGDASDDGAYEMGSVEDGADQGDKHKKVGGTAAARGGTGVGLRRGTGGGGSESTEGGTTKCCQAEKCMADLSDSKPYHKRHRVCENHAKAQVVLVSGTRQRFCQQCSRFHELSEFDETKRSCRRRLAGHNERRRKVAGESAAEGSSRRGTGGHLKDMVCGQIDERGRIKITIQKDATYKHFEIR